MIKCPFKCHSWTREINNIASVESTLTLYGHRSRDLVVLTVPARLRVWNSKVLIHFRDVTIVAARATNEDARCLAKSRLVAMVTRSNSQYRKDTSTSRGGSHAAEAARKLRLSYALLQPLRVGDQCDIGVTVTNEPWKSETVDIDRH